MSPSPSTQKIVSNRPQEMVSREEEKKLFRKLAFNGSISRKEMDALLHRNERMAEEYRNRRKQLHRESPVLKRRKTDTIETNIHKHHKGIISEKEERVLMNRLTSCGKLSSDEVDALLNRSKCIGAAKRRRHEEFMASWREEKAKCKAYVESSKRIYKETKHALEKSRREWQELQKELEEGIQSKKKFDEDTARWWKEQEEYEKRREQSRKHYLH